MWTPVTGWGFFVAFELALTVMTLLLVIVFAALEFSAGRIQTLTLVWTITFVLFSWIMLRTLLSWVGGLRAALRAEGTQGKLLAIVMIALPILATAFFWMLLINTGQVRG
jgi:hypothetical protein